MTIWSDHMERPGAGKAMRGLPTAWRIAARVAWANADNAVQIDLYCRPCSVFGNIPCYRGDHACMEWLDPALIVEKLSSLSPQQSL